MYNVGEIMLTVNHLANNYREIKKIYLFGSYARGDATEKSDIDLRVDVDPTIGLKLGEFYTDLESSLSSKIDLVTTRQLSAYFLKEISSEEILIYDKQ